MINKFLLIIIDGRRPNPLGCDNNNSRGDRNEAGRHAIISGTIALEKFLIWATMQELHRFCFLGNGGINNRKTQVRTVSNPEKAISALRAWQKHTGWPTNVLPKRYVRGWKSPGSPFFRR